jgi:hypothetical protein
MQPVKQVMKWRGLFVVPAAAVAIAALPAAAGAGSGPVTETQEGRTSQRMPVSVEVGQDAQLVRVSLRYRARCGNGTTLRSRIVWQDEEGTDAGFERDADFFSYRDTSRGRYRGRRTIISSSLTGEPANGGGYEGKFSVRVRVRSRAGTTISTCRTGSQTYRTYEPEG